MSVRLFVAEVEVGFEGIRLPEGHVVNVELARPRRRYAVIVDPEGEAPEVIALYDDEDEAVGACQGLAQSLSGEASEEVKRLLN